MEKCLKTGVIGWLTASLLIAGSALTIGTASAAPSILKLG